LVNVWPHRGTANEKVQFEKTVEWKAVEVESGEESITMGWNGRSTVTHRGKTQTHKTTHANQAKSHEGERNEYAISTSQ